MTETALIQALLAAVSALGGGVVFMYFQVNQNLRDQKRECNEREEKCNVKHDALLEKYIRLEARIIADEGRLSDHETRDARRRA